MTLTNSTFLKACRMEPSEHTPVWFMRQAGRYQPEYREIRKKYSLLEICRHPDICTEVTLLPVKQLGVDAAILFSDITLPFGPLGLDFDIVEGIGPVIHTPVRNLADVQNLLVFDPSESLSFVGETIANLVSELNVPLIGFVGAPFTLASYMIEGGPSKSFIKTKSFMYNQPEAWHLLMDKLALTMSNYLRYQHTKGAHALQVFDSWVGNLSQEDYRQYVFPHMQKLFSAFEGLDMPLIHFGVVTQHLLTMMKDSGSSVIGLDWRVRIDESWKLLNYEVAIQGNLDPAALIANEDFLKMKIDHILGQVDRPGFIFNLGHGIMPHSSIDVLKWITDYVHDYSIKY
jgi:uroporphyrinogen decarboxylase